MTEGSNQGTDTVQSSISYALGSNVENLMLTGTDDIDGTGNTLANTLTGNAGANVLSGGSGNDTYIIDASADTVVEGVGQGTDTVQSSISYTLGDNVENLTLTGTDNIDGTGNALNNVIVGNSGNNVLDGAAGNDPMTGGAGDDTYVVDAAGDVVIESANQGTDTVLASITYTLGTNVENLTLTGSGNINGTGNTVANILSGNAGNNTLSGGGGDDAMSGGSGNDTYVVADAGDTVTENTNEGIDTVQSSVSFTLGANVENLTLTGSANIDATGNELDNTLTGNSGSNVIDGGAGDDIMIGGSGNDTYVVDSAGDTVTDTSGTDTVQTSVSFTLGANVENLTLTGTDDINATGNALANTLTGNAGVNILDGGAGNDIYVVGVGDTVVEGVGQGTDTVQAGFSYVLGDNVENLTLTGTDDINATGNTLNNTLTGNAGVNVLQGGRRQRHLRGGRRRYRHRGRRARYRHGAGWLHLHAGR
ncbi:MAG: calcium-binding protein [Hyphomicrobium sp.]